MQVTAYLGIGSNIQDRVGRTPLQQCLGAVRRVLAALGAHQPLVSHWYRTSPIPASDQPDYVNGIVAAVVSMSPSDILMTLQQVEAEAGRVRTVRNAARTLDLDIVALDGLVLSTPTLTVPHPRMHERAFVLAPLCDIAPTWRHPLLGVTATALLDRVGDQQIARLPPVPATEYLP